MDITAHQTLEPCLPVFLTLVEIQSFNLTTDKYAIMEMMKAVLIVKLLTAGSVLPDLSESLTAKKFLSQTLTWIVEMDFTNLSMVNSVMMGMLSLVMVVLGVVKLKMGIIALLECLIGLLNVYKLKFPFVEME